ncbi:MAG: ATPase subunit of ABC transporter with duplicated ATPase domains [Paraglaciecola sp.]|jgi:ATPase subunit of ABC transporter with duplicated ATPase domains
MQFCHLDFTLPEGLTGLVGDNGIGKSLLADIIRGKVKATTGTVDVAGPLLFLGQNSHVALAKNETVAEHCGAAPKLKALKNIENGSIEQQDYQTVGDDWLFAHTFKVQLAKLSKNITPDSTLAELSGGELNKVMLYHLFVKAQLQDGILLLDEPSNHLDTGTKQWLAEQLLAFKGKCLLISHDRMLLNLCRHIAKLTPVAIELTESNHEAFELQYLQHEEARYKKMHQLQLQQKKAKFIAQRDTEKAQKRAGQGVKKGKQGGMPKVLLGAKQHKAESSLSAKLSQHQSKLTNIEQQLQAVKADNVAKPIQFGFTSSQQKVKRLIYLKDAILPHVNATVSMEVKQGEKWHLTGANGSGKSAFLNLFDSLSFAQKTQQKNASSAVLNTLQLSGSAIINTRVCLLDQHCSLIRNQDDMLENLSHFCPHLSHSDLRTLLATNGFRKDKVFQKAGLLSGGEKMRLAMLIASRQQDSLLLLDEPDNHLDISSQDILSDALLRYNSSFILVSHSQEFVSKCGITHTYSLT